MHWPRIFEVRPAFILTCALLLIALAWSRILIDMAVAPNDPAWFHLFNDGPVEWIQWLVLPATAVAAGFVAARLTGGAASFFILLAVGTSLMLFEDAGDARHVISDNVVARVGERMDPFLAETLSDLVYFGLLAAVPLYALVRYGRFVWSVAAVRRYLVAGFGLYAVAATASGLKWVGDLYVRTGRFVDERVLGGRLPLPEGASREAGWFELMDGPFEESIETIAATCLLGVVLAYASWWRSSVGNEPSTMSPGDHA